MRFTPPSIGTVAPGNAPGGGKEARRRAQRGGNRSRPQGVAGLWPSGRGLHGGSSSSLSRLRPRPGLWGHSPHPARDGTFRVGLGSGCSPGPPGPPLPPAGTRRLRGRCRLWRAPGPAPSRVAGLRGVGRGWGLLRWEPEPFPFLRPSAARFRCPHPFWSPRPSPPSPGAPSPGVPAAPFHQNPLTLYRLAFSFTSQLPLWFRSAFQESDPERLLEASGLVRGDFLP